MDILPLEITENILVRLSIISQLQCRGICTTWRTLLPKPKKGLLYGVSVSRQEKSDQVVNTTKLGHSLITSPSFYRSFMVGSCNGLVFYAGRERWIERETIVYICNPFTRQHIQLPSIKSGYNDWNSTMIGFGYVHSSREYKVVSFWCNNWCGKVDVYTLRSGGGGCTGTGWRNKASMIKEDLMSYFIGLPSAAVFTGGALHWLNLVDRHKPTPVAFDLESETFELLPLLPFKITDKNHVELMELVGDLCVMEVIPSKHITNIWELRHGKIIEYEPSWYTKFSITWEDYLVGIPDGMRCMLWYNVILSCYDHETETLRKPDETLKKLKKTKSCFFESLYATNRLTPHMNSLVSLKAFNGRHVKNSSRLNLKKKIFLRH